MTKNGTILSTAANGNGASATRAWLVAPPAVDQRAVNAMHEEGRILALPARAGDDLVRSWQLDAHGQPLPVMRRLLASARDAGLDDVRLHALLGMRAGLTRPERLVDVLLAGGTEHVLRAIRSAR